MLNELDTAIEHHWDLQRTALGESVSRTVKELERLLRLDDQHRHGHKEDRLQAALGPMAAGSMDLAALSETLVKGSQGTPLALDRVDRIEGLVETLADLKAGRLQGEAQCPRVSLETEESAILEEAENHYNAYAEVFRVIRMAQLEIRAKYEPARHDAGFTGFTWHQLSPSERRLCPPFVVTAEMGNTGSGVLRRIIPLLESRMPLRIVVVRTRLRKVYPPTADPSVPTNLSIEMLPLSMRGVYFLQTCPVEEAFRSQLFGAMTSSRPSLVSVLSNKPEEDPDHFRHRASCAVRSRAFPMFVYDPDMAPGFVSCFDLSLNPDPEADWGGDPENPFTFAHYAVMEKDYAGEFGKPPVETPVSSMVGLVEFLQLSPRQRVGKLPVVEFHDKRGNLKRRLVSPSLVTQTADHIHLWKTLQEISGVRNPHVAASTDALKAELGAEQQVLVDNLRHEMEADQSHRERVAVATALRRLVAEFTGVEEEEIELGKLLGK